MPAIGTVQFSPIAAAIAFALMKGVPMDEITRVTGLEYEDLLKPMQYVDNDVVAAVFDLLARALPGEALGLQLAAGAPFSYFGVLAHAAVYAEDLRDAIEVWLRYHKLLASELRVGFEEGPTECRLWLHHPNDERAPNPIPPEATLGLTARFLREALEIEGALARVEFSHAPAGPLAVYKKFFGVDARFERPRNSLVFHTAALSRSTARADFRRYEFLFEHLQFLERQLAEEREHEEVQRVRAAILKNARRGEYGAEALAKGLGMSLRSAQRLVKTHGRSLRTLLDDVREQHARRLLKDPRLSVEEIAFLLGYSAESAFRRAFKRWAGVSPAELRRA